jgi:hypothetical protein
MTAGIVALHLARTVCLSCRRSGQLLFTSFPSGKKLTSGQERLLIVPEQYGTGHEASLCLMGGELPAAPSGAVPVTCIGMPLIDGAWPDGTLLAG